MKVQSVVSGAMVLLAVFSGAAVAQSAHHNHGAKAAVAPAGNELVNDLANGEVRKVNKSSGKITLKHGDIKSVDMPPMTMVFGVTDKAMLDGLAEGDKVKFNVKKDGSNYVVTEIKKAP